jgi:hypothetical protein
MQGQKRKAILIENLKGKYDLRDLSVYWWII